jgi:hypothetical protein
MFISNLNQKKKRVCEETLNKILRKTINIKPTIGAKNKQQRKNFFAALKKIIFLHDFINLVFEVTFSRQ